MISIKTMYLNLKTMFFFKLSDLSDGKRTHYFTSTYNLKSGRIIEEFINLNPNFGKMQSTKNMGTVRKPFFKIVKMKKL